jgi:non-specific serine/threonine protein kinase
MEAAGLVVRVPDWWKPSRPKRPVVSVKIGEAAKSKLGMDALLDFSVGVTLEGQGVSEADLQELLNSGDGLVRLRGQWVEVDREKLSAALAHWKDVEREARGGGISFFEGMRLLAGADVESKDEPKQLETIREWSGLSAGTWLDQTLDELRHPDGQNRPAPAGLHAELRPYQQAGVSWLRFMTKLGLGACLADDMGLGKTIQMIALLLHVQEAREPSKNGKKPSLLVVPASLISNWKSELARFAPSLTAEVVHPSEPQSQEKSRLQTCDLVITTYGMLTRQEALRTQPWNIVALDEAQAIKNSGTRQAKVVKELQATSRIALTGTPVENRLSDLWSLFDFLNPGLLGSAKAFSRFCKSLSQEEGKSFGPLRTLVKPYILRRLKTDKRIISDLPDKTEVKAFCGLSKRQAALYEQSVRELADQIGKVDGIQRRGLVLAYLMRFKQICNHPAQWTGDGAYEPKDSGKFHRLAELCEELAARQEKVLVFTQFREIVDPLAAYLVTVFGKPGLTLHGGTDVSKRRDRVKAFQADDGPPFFVLSIKAGGTGLNLTAASQVIHFDRWWNPAVENQATDRAFRIGQKRNVLVHKFVCRGTIEEKIDQMIADKLSLSSDLLEGGAEKMLTEMNNRELIDFVSLDVSKAAEE